MDNLKRRDTQTKVKHAILEAYLQQWAMIIAMGAKRSYERCQSTGRGFHLRLVYVDCFAFQGRYADEEGVQEPIYGSPIIGIRTLEKAKQIARQKAGFQPDTAYVLIEKEHSDYLALIQNLTEAGYGPRVRETVDFSSLSDGGIAVIHGDFQGHINTLRSFTTQNYNWAFYFLDPFGPSGLPLDIVGGLITLQRTDVMINFPYLDLLKKTGSVVRNTPSHQGHLRHFDRLYGSQAWREVAKSIDDSDQRETELVDRYVATLQQCDPDVAIKFVPVMFPDRERTIFYLLLTTHDPTGALAINEILDDSKLREYDLRFQRKNVKELEQKGATQLSFFGEEIPDPARPTSVRPTVDEIAVDIFDLCEGQRIRYRDVLKRVINRLYYHSEIKRAMGLLKRKKLVNYDGDLYNDTEVAFSSRPR